jgi:pimeloyl-ACP methyl ester carboxylesterase
MLLATGDIDTAWFEVGHGTPIVLVHGLGDDHRAWRRVIPPLTLGHRVILYDLRGHGESSLGEADGSLRQLSGDLVALLTRLDIDRAVLAGFSLGGTIAMRTAIDAPERVAALALVATSSRVNTSARTWYEERATMVAEHAPWLRDTLDRDTEDVYRQRPEEIADGLLIRRQATADPRGYANACRAMGSLKEHPLDDELNAITAPTVVLSGEADQHCPPRAGEIIAARITGSGVEVLSETGHPLPVERPAEVATAITDIASASSN